MSVPSLLPVEAQACPYSPEKRYCFVQPFGKEAAAPFSQTSFNVLCDGERMTRDEKKQSFLSAGSLIGLPAQLYEFHEAVEVESKKTGLARLLKSDADRSITVAARDMEHALTYLSSYMPDFRVQTVTPRGTILIVIERAESKVMR
jgi:hypothetical protein